MAAVSIELGAGTVQASLGMTGSNVKLDILDGRLLAASTHLALGAGAQDGRLLGVAGLSLSGNNGGNGLEGNAGANLVKGMGGNDWLRGMAGNDSLDGGTGNDALVGGTGRDTLRGGAGADDFVFLSASHSGPSATTRDAVLDFARGQDDIVLSAIDAHRGLAGNQAFALDANGSFSAGEIRQVVVGGNLTIMLNADDDQAAEMSIVLEGVTAPLAAGDFWL